MQNLGEGGGGGANKEYYGIFRSGLLMKALNTPLLRCAWSTYAYSQLREQILRSLHRLNLLDMELSTG